MHVVCVWYGTAVYCTCRESCLLLVCTDMSDTTRRSSLLLYCCRSTKRAPGILHKLNTNHTPHNRRFKFNAGEQVSSGLSFHMHNTARGVCVRVCVLPSHRLWTPVYTHATFRYITSRSYVGHLSISRGWSHRTEVFFFFSC